MAFLVENGGKLTSNDMPPDPQGLQIEGKPKHFVFDV